MGILTFFAPFSLLVIGFVISVAAGAVGDAASARPVSPLAALLTAAIFLVLQAILWVRLGTTL